MLLSNCRLTVISTFWYSDTVVWHENSGETEPIFTSHIITTSQPNALYINPADLDSDGNVDLVVKGLGEAVVWYHNQGSMPLTFRAHTITESDSTPPAIEVVDMDQDSDLDIISTFGNHIVWYKNDGEIPPSFTSQVIPYTIYNPWSIDAADLDGDDDVDILVGTSDNVMWLENNGQIPPMFTLDEIAHYGDDAQVVAIQTIDINGDNDLDILTLLWDWDNVYWYENNGASPPNFTEHLIDDAVGGPSMLTSTDIDVDGDIDIFATSGHNDQIIWYEHNGISPATFSKHIAFEITSPNALAVADVDRDGDLDILSASDEGVIWHPNMGGQVAVSVTNTAPAAIHGGERDDILQIVATHQGVAADEEAHLVSLDLYFDDGYGNPLTSAAATQLFKAIYIYADDGSGDFDSALDTRIAKTQPLPSITGTQRITITDNAWMATISHNRPVTFFVVTEVADDTLSYTPNQFRVTYVDNVFEDDAGRPLLLAFAPVVTSSTVVAAFSRCYTRINDHPTEYRKVQDAVDAAQEGDTVKVAGHCFGVEERAGLTQTVYISKSLTLQGGYTTTNWIVSDPVSYATVLNAQQEGRVIYVSGDITVTIQGLHIVGGGKFRVKLGGGIYALTSTLYIIDNEIINNFGMHGGGLAFQNATATILRNIIDENMAVDGGGMHLEYSNIVARDNIISGNFAGYDGGGIYAAHSTILLDGNHVNRNWVNSYDEYRFGAGLSLFDSHATLRKNIFQGNVCEADITCSGGGISTINSDITLTDDLLVNNTADQGGGMYARDTSIALIETTFSENTAAYVGGGIYTLGNNDTSIESGIFSNNFSGSMSLSGNTATLTNTIIANNDFVDNHNAIALYVSSAHLLHTTVVGQHNGAGIYLSTDQAFLTNTIVVSNAVGINVAENSTATIEGTLWGDGTWANGVDWQGDGTLITGTTNVWGDPAFVAPDQGDYHILPTSAAKDAGVPTAVHVDIDGQARPYDAAPDLGADEWWNPSAIEITAGPPSATIIYRVPVTNTGTQSDSFTVSNSGNVWSVVAPSKIGPIASGEMLPLVITVTTPLNIPMSHYPLQDSLAITISSILNPLQFEVVSLQTRINPFGADLIYLPLILRE